MEKIILIVLLLLLIACHKKDGIDALVDKMQKQNKQESFQCNCGKTNLELQNIPDDKVNTFEKIQKYLGNPDTSYADTAVLACTSFVYDCGKTFVAFHFKNEKYIGKSNGEIINNKHVIFGSGIHIE